MLKELFSKTLNIRTNLNEWSYISVEIPLVVNCQQGKKISKQIQKYIIGEATCGGCDQRQGVEKMSRKRTTNCYQNKLVQIDVNKLIQKKPV